MTPYLIPAAPSKEVKGPDCRPLASWRGTGTGRVTAPFTRPDPHSMAEQGSGLVAFSVAKAIHVKAIHHDGDDSTSARDACAAYNFASRTSGQNEQQLN